MRDVLTVFVTVLSVLLLLATASLVVLGIYTLFEFGCPLLGGAYVAGVLIVNGAVWLANRGLW